MVSRRWMGLVVWLVVACSAGGSPGTSVQGAEQAGTSSSVAKTGSEAMSLPELGEVLEPGTYSTAVFQPRLTFTIEETWRVEIPDLSRIVGIAYHGGGFDDELFPLLSFSRLEAVYDLDQSSSASAEGEPPTVPVPDDLIGFFLESPGLDSSEPTDTTVAGLPARQIDAIVASSNLSGSDEEMHEEAGERPPFLVGPIEGQPLYFPVGEKVRIIVVDVGGEQVMINVEGHPDEFDEFISIAERVLNTVRFDGQG